MLNRSIVGTFNGSGQGANTGEIGDLSGRAFLSSVLIDAENGGSVTSAQLILKRDIEAGASGTPKEFPIGTFSVVPSGGNIRHIEVLPDHLPILEGDVLEVDLDSGADGKVQFVISVR